MRKPKLKYDTIVVVRRDVKGRKLEDVYTHAYVQFLEGGAIIIHRRDGHLHSYEKDKYECVKNYTTKSSAHPALPNVWIPVHVALPRTAHRVLVLCRLEGQTQRGAVTAALYQRERERFDPDFPDEFDHLWDEEEEAYFYEPGWYESMMTMDDLYALEGVTHWMPMPHDAVEVFPVPPVRVAQEGEE